MRIRPLLVILVIAICCHSCHRTKKAPTDRGNEVRIDHHILRPEFQSIIDSADVVGSILLFDFQKDVYYSNDFEWANVGKLPASTFKIANTIIGLETGIIESDTTVFKWDGERKANQNWEQDLVLRDAFHLSCVPCYQGVAREIGEKQMNRYLDTLSYGKMQVDSSSIDSFWLRGDSRITQMQQIDFLKRLYTSELPISKRTERILKNLMVIEETEDYRLSGKSGLSNADDRYNGWFVGYLERGADTYFFATNIEPTINFDFASFIQKRMGVTFGALKQIEVME